MYVMLFCCMLSLLSSPLLSSHVLSVGECVAPSGRHPPRQSLPRVLPGPAQHAALAQQVGPLHARLLAAAGRAQVQHLSPGQWRADTQDLRSYPGAYRASDAQVGGLVCVGGCITGLCAVVVN